MNLMNQAAQKLLDDALQLPADERADLAGHLIDSLDQQVDEDADSAWNAEIHRRLKDLDSGSVKPIPWPNARRMIVE